MNIRRAMESDRDGINRLLEQVCMVHHNGRPDLFQAGKRKYTDEELTAIIHDEERPIFVAVEEDNTLLGYAFCMFERHEDSHAFQNITALYIDDLCVEEACRGQHVGTALYQHVLAFAREAGCYHVTLNVWCLNEGARKFYEACGMKPLKIAMETIL